MTGTELLVLSPHGHVEHHAVVADDGATTWLDVEPGDGAGAAGLPAAMRFMMRVEPADVTADWALLSLVGPRGRRRARRARRRLSGRAGRASPVPGPKFAAGSVAGPTEHPVRRPRAARPAAGRAGCRTGRTCWCRGPQSPRSSASSRRGRAAGRDLGVRGAAGGGSAAAARLRDRPPDAAGRGRLAARRVHLDKGCYRGQETVARVHNLGRPPRRLVLLHLDGITTDELPAPGTPVPRRRPDGRVRRHRRAPLRARADRAGRGEAERRPTTRR